MASGPSTSWQIDGEKMETVTNVIFFSSEITVDGDCSHEIKRGLLVEKKSYDQTRHCIKRKRHYFTKKGPYVKAKFSQSSCMDGRVGPLRKLITEELILLNCGVGEDS